MPAGPTPDDGSLALALDLTAAGLRSGCPLSAALALAARAVAAPFADVLTRAATLDRLGAPPEEVWSGLPRDGPLGEVARVATRSAASGLKLAAGLERLATEMRADRAAAAAARAHRAAVWAVAPLAACFLPSFVCLGVIPVVVGVARQVVGGIRGGF
jgi:pilus assembly protein TadC